MADKKVVVVLGARGLQGGGVVNALLRDGTYAVRAISRNTEDEAAKKLIARGVSVVKADANNVDELTEAFKGADAVFGMTNYWDQQLLGSAIQSSDFTLEFKQGKNIGDAAKRAGVNYLVFSSLESVSKRSNGKYTHVYHFDQKNEAEQYIRQLGIPATFVYPGAFFSNTTPRRPDPNGPVLIFALGTNTELELEYLDAGVDVGDVTLGLLKNRHEWLGKVIPIGAKVTTKQIAEAYAKVTGLPTVAVGATIDQAFADSPPLIREEMNDNLNYILEFGYFAPDRDFTAAEKLAGHPITTPEEYFSRLDKSKLVPF